MDPSCVGIGTTTKKSSMPTRIEVYLDAFPAAFQRRTIRAIWMAIPSNKVTSVDREYGKGGLCLSGAKGVSLENGQITGEQGQKLGTG